MADLDVALRLQDESKRGFDSFRRNAKGAEGSARGLGKSGSTSIGSIGSAAKIAGAAVGGIAAAAVGVAAKLVSDFAAAGAELRNFETQSGANAQELQELAFIARDSGGDISDVSDAFREMGIRLGEATSHGTGPAIDALNSLGISLDSLRGLAPEKQFEILRDAISQVQDPAQQLFLAEELLGGSTERLGAVIGATTEELAAFRDEANRSGAVLNEAAVESAKEAAEAVQTLGDAFKGLTAAVGQAFAPALTGAASVVEYATGVIHDNEAAASELERRNLFMARAMEEATTATVQLSFGLVEVKGITEDYNETLDQILSTVDKQVEVYGAFRNATREVTDETEEASEQIKGLDTDLTGAGGAAIYLTDQAVPLQGALRNIANEAATARQAVSDLRDEIILNARIAQQESLADEYALFETTRPTSVPTPSRAPGRGRGGPSGTELTVEEQGELTRGRLEENLEQLYASNRISDESYQALLNSNNIQETLNTLVSKASEDELSGLSSIRSTAYNLGLIQAEGSRAIVKAIESMRDALREEAKLARTQAANNIHYESRNAVGGSRTVNEWAEILGIANDPTGAITNAILQELADAGIDTSDRNTDFIAELEQFNTVNAIVAPHQGSSQAGPGQLNIMVELDGEPLDARITQTVNDGMTSGEIG